MTESEGSGTGDLQRKLYQDLDQKLKSSEWNSGASEAHGLLTGLACRGVGSREIGNKMYLFQISGAEEIGMLEGMFEMIVRDLESPQFVFNILIPGDDVSTMQIAEEISNWCEGYLQGFFHDGDSLLGESSDSVQELVKDITDIGGLNLDTVEESSTGESSLVEIEEYLRVGVQLIYDELVQLTDSSDRPNKSEIH
jgi:uncharacterized protein YgfB (UPF0149 family)